MRTLIAILLLTGCASQPVKPIEHLPEDSETSAAAVGTVSMWRWVGKFVLRLVTNTTVNVEIKETK